MDARSARTLRSINLGAGGLHLRLTRNIHAGSDVTVAARLSTVSDPRIPALRFVARGIVLPTEAEPDGTWMFLTRTLRLDSAFVMCRILSPWILIVDRMMEVLTRNSSYWKDAVPFIMWPDPLEKDRAAQLSRTSIPISSVTIRRHIGIAGRP